ncbi:MAG: glycosyltransferase family 2 protein [Anaerolineae bacterium]|nr:glycosyltransferase family 2 protein [Anaerolineae bacterium]
MQISIIATMYRSANYLAEFCRRASAAALQCCDAYEIILVNDGSPDDSVQVALGLRAENPHIKVIDLARNHGHHKAIMIGLAHTQGELVFLLDVDLEEAPELLIEMHKTLHDKHADIVYGVQIARQGSWFKRTTGEWFYRLFNLLSAVNIPRDMVMARLMRRTFVQTLVAHRDQEPFLAGLSVLSGFSQVSLAVNKTYKGSSTYTLSRRVSQTINAITAFSSRPLSLIFYLGSLISLFGFIFVGYVVVRAMLFGFAEGWASVIASIWLIGGLIIFCLGIIGMYLARIYIETKPRPYAIIRNIYE